MIILKRCYVYVYRVLEYLFTMLLAEVAYSTSLVLHLLVCIGCTYCFLGSSWQRGSRIKKVQMDFRNWGREVTAVCLSIEVFLREKPSVVVIRPVSMKLKVHPEVFHNLYIWEVKAM